jgi:hypothetical protein
MAVQLPRLPASKSQESLSSDLMCADCRRFANAELCKPATNPAFATPWQPWRGQHAGRHRRPPGRRGRGRATATVRAPRLCFFVLCQDGLRRSPGTSSVDARPALLRQTCAGLSLNPSACRPEPSTVPSHTARYLDALYLDDPLSALGRHVDADGNPLVPGDTLGKFRHLNGQDIPAGGAMHADGRAPHASTRKALGLTAGQHMRGSGQDGMDAPQDTGLDSDHDSSGNWLRRTALAASAPSVGTMNASGSDSALGPARLDEHGRPLVGLNNGVRSGAPSVMDEQQQPQGTSRASGDASPSGLQPHGDVPALSFTSGPAARGVDAPECGADLKPQYAAGPVKACASLTRSILSMLSLTDTSFRCIFQASHFLQGAQSIASGRIPGRRHVALCRRHLAAKTGTLWRQPGGQPAERTSSGQRWWWECSRL